MTEAQEFARGLLYAGAAFSIGFLIFHVFFWKLFRWKSELAKVSGVNRDVVQVMNLCQMLVFALSLDRGAQ